MRLNNHILSNLREADSKKIDDLYSYVLNCQEMYIETANDPDDVFAGTEDEYAYEVMSQNLFDALAYSGLFKDENDPRIVVVYNKLIDLITSNANISKKDIEDIIKVSGIKEGTNGNAKILDYELTGGGVISFVGEVGNYNFVGDIDGSIEFFDKNLGIDSWEKYASIEDDAWEGKYGEDIQGTYDFEQKYAKYLPEYIPNIGRALKQYAKNINEFGYRKQFEDFGDELSNYKEEKIEEAYNIKSDEDIENEVEKYRTSQNDKISKYLAQDEEEYNKYVKDREDRINKYKADNEPTEERLNAKREELLKKREEEKAQNQKWFEETKEDKKEYFSNVNKLTDLSDNENPSDFKYGGFNVCFTYNGKSYWVEWYDSDVYLPNDRRDGYSQWCGGYEIPNEDVHKYKSDIKKLRAMDPEEFGLEVKPGSKDRVKGIIDLSKLD